MALAWVLCAAPGASAATQTASAGGVTATFTFQGHYPFFHGESLRITQGGAVVYSQPVVSRFPCGRSCAPASTTRGSLAVHVLDLEGNGQQDVVLDLYSGGAHCCSIEQVYWERPGSTTFNRSEYDFGDPGASIVDLAHNGRFEFLTADDAFAYQFTDFAASGLPVQVLSFGQGVFSNVTRSYPALITRDAAKWLRAFKAQARQHYADTTGVIAAWAADEEELGNTALVSSFLARQAAARHLNTPLAPVEPQNAAFVTKLQRFLLRRGYASQGQGLP